MGCRAMVSPNRDQGPHIPILANQDSQCNLINFDEVRNDKLGNSNQPLKSTPMNLDEYPSFSSSSSASVFQGNINLNGTLSRKTVDKAWKDTVVQPQPLMAIDPTTVVVSQQADWFDFPMQPVVGDLNFQVSETGFENPPPVEFGQSENLQLELPMPMSLVPKISSDPQVGFKIKHCCDMTEKTIERRQKRMIKNRESAARSRARKQAHTNQLEHKAFHLRKANSRLKRKKEANMLLSLNSTSKPRFQLRRTSSASF